MIASPPQRARTHAHTHTSVKRSLQSAPIVFVTVGGNIYIHKYSRGGSLGFSKKTVVVPGRWINKVGLPTVKMSSWLLRSTKSLNVRNKKESRKRADVAAMYIHTMLTIRANIRALWIRFTK